MVPRGAPTTLPFLDHISSGEHDTYLYHPPVRAPRARDIACMAALERGPQHHSSPHSQCTTRYHKRLHSKRRLADKKEWPTAFREMRIYPLCAKVVRGWPVQSQLKISN